MTKTYTAIVAGLGAMGSAAAYHLARRGGRVLGLEQFWAGHDRGSSHGKSRVIRQAYFEGTAYVPLVLRAYELWRALEMETGRRLLTITGGLMLGNPSSHCVEGAARSAVAFGLEHEVLTTGELRRRFPQFAVGGDCQALYEKQAGVLNPEACVLAHQEAAARQGAELRFNERILNIERGRADGLLSVATSAGTYSAERLVMTCGAWTGKLGPGMRLPLAPERRVMHWFAPRSPIQEFAPPHFPIWIWEHQDGVEAYGFPGLDGPHGGVKFAFHNRQAAACDPDTLDRSVTAEEIQAAAAHLRQHLPGLAGRHLNSVACMYTLTPDHHFAIGLHPEDERIALGAGFSGHGFKFASAVGEVLAELAVDGRTGWDISAFRPDRWS
jgi:sarcosine oxidase